MLASIKARQLSRPRSAVPVVTFGRHQLAAVVSTALDFATMALFRSVLDASAVQATVLGATIGGIVNFELGRRWVFAAQKRARGPQALRYAVVSMGAVALNALGMMILESSFQSTHYVLLRVVVSFMVGVLWSFPAQGRLVFAKA